MEIAKKDMENFLFSGTPLMRKKFITRDAQKVTELKVI